MIRNLFVREESDRLVVGSGLLPRWLAAGEPLRFGPTLTPWGAVTIRLEPEAPRRLRLILEADWRAAPPAIEVALPHPARVSRPVADGSFLIEVER
jgi:hypothetical protein